jgi:hypothetical protein
LTIEGKVSKKVIAQLTTDAELKKNQGWFFIDFAITEIPLHTKFDILLEGENKVPIAGPGSVAVTLVAVLDQRGNKLPAVPEGYDTICKLEFSPEIPASIKNLPSLSGWNYNPNAISIADHQSIAFAPGDDVVDDLFSIVYLHLRTKFKSENKRAFSRKYFVSQLENVSHVHPVNANKILLNLMQLGKVTKKAADQFEFAEPLI